MPPVKWYRTHTSRTFFSLLPLRLKPRFSARRLMHWHPSPGATLNSQILAEACGCAESLGGSKDGRWKTSIFFYRAMTRDGAGGPAVQQHPDLPRELLGVALHERPGLYFSIVRAQRLVLQADAAFPQVMEKLQSYRIRVALNFEVPFALLVPDSTPVFRVLLLGVLFCFDSSDSGQMCL
jgi:hypothetical protein